MTDPSPTESSEPTNSPDQAAQSPSDADATWAEAEQTLSQASQQAEALKTAGPVPPVDAVSSTVRSLGANSPLVMVETAFLASAASLIWLVNFYFPIGPVLRIFFPIPIALIYMRWGARAAWMGALVSGLLLSVLMGPPRSILYVMPFGVMGVLLGVLWYRRAGWGIAIVLGSILATFGFFFRVWLVSLLLGDDLWLYSTTQATNLVDWVCLRLGILFQPSLWLIQAIVALLVVINSVVYLFVVHLVALFLFDRLRNPIPRPPKWVQVLLEYEE